MATETTDLKQISERLSLRKNMADGGYYAPVERVVLTEHDDGSETLDLHLLFPDGGDTVYKTSVPEYWDSSKKLPQLLADLDIPVSDLKDLEKRGLPIMRVDGSWEVDETRLSEGDYNDGKEFTKKKDKKKDKK